MQELSMKAFLDDLKVGETVTAKSPDGKVVKLEVKEIN
jgi:hypothetical protein